jgi:hypothetical protein
MSERGGASQGSRKKSLAMIAAHSAWVLDGGAQADLCTPGAAGGYPPTFTFGPVETPKIHSADGLGLEQGASRKTR